MTGFGGVRIPLRLLPAPAGRPGVAAVLQRAVQAWRTWAAGSRRTTASRTTVRRTCQTTTLTDENDRSLITRPDQIPHGRHADDHRQPHRQAVRDPDSGRHDPGHGSAADQGRPGRVRADDVRPGVHEHGRVPQPDHLHRRRQGHPALPRLSDRAAGRAQRLPRDGVPDPLRRAADRARSISSGRTTSRSTRCCTRTSRS